MNNYIPTNLFDSAAKYVIDKHKNMEHNDLNIPAALHCFEVATVVASITDNPDIIAASLMHDILEKTNTPFYEIATYFGRTVAEIVEDCTPPVDDIDLDLESRIRSYVEFIENSEHEIKIIILADKLCDLREMFQGYLETGVDIFRKYGMNQFELGIVYDKFLEALYELRYTPAYKEFAYLIKAAFQQKNTLL